MTKLELRVRILLGGEYDIDHIMYIKIVSSLFDDTDNWHFDKLEIIQLFMWYFRSQKVLFRLVNLLMKLSFSGGGGGR